MVEINPIYQALPNSSTADTLSRTSTELASNFDTFLTLLTQQLQNQDPLNPMDSQQFVSQLVEFSSVEQQIASNQSLDALLQLQSASARLSAVDYIGKLATASSSDAALNEGSAEWTYALDREARTNQLVITNAQGRHIATFPGELSSGPHTFTWDGRDEGGNLQPEGVYTLEVVAKDANDVRLEVPSRVSAEVTGVDMSGEDIVVEMGGLRIPAAQIIAVRRAAALTV